MWLKFCCNSFKFVSLLKLIKGVTKFSLMKITKVKCRYTLMFIIPATANVLSLLYIPILPVDSEWICYGIIISLHMYIKWAVFTCVSDTYDCKYSNKEMHTIMNAQVNLKQRDRFNCNDCSNIIIYVCRRYRCWIRQKQSHWCRRRQIKCLCQHI